MPSLKDLRNRIASVKATRKITKAMQMVAAAKLRRAQEAATAARPYAERMNHVLAIITSERGLCGAFNANIVRLARQDIQRLLAEGKTVKILSVGRKGYDM